MALWEAVRRWVPSRPSGRERQPLVTKYPALQEVSPQTRLLLVRALAKQTSATGDVGQPARQSMARIRARVKVDAHDRIVTPSFYIPATLRPPEDSAAESISATAPRSYIASSALTRDAEADRDGSESPGDEHDSTATATGHVASTARDAETDREDGESPAGEHDNTMTVFTIIPRFKPDTSCTAGETPGTDNETVDESDGAGG